MASIDRGKYATDKLANVRPGKQTAETSARGTSISLYTEEAGTTSKAWILCI